jgi:hypothetical protein
LPRDLALEFGEMLYQLRAVLDTCVYQAAVLDSGRDPPPDEQTLEFPICLTPASWKESARKIRPLAQERRAIIEKVQPCHAERSPNLTRVIRALGILNDWARKDRHRRLHVVRIWFNSARPRLRVSEPVRIIAHTPITPGFVDDQAEVSRFVLDGWEPGAKVEADADVSFDIAVDEVPTPERPDDTLTRRIAEMFFAVKWVVETFEKSFEPPYVIARFRPQP